MNLHKQNFVCWPSVGPQDIKQTYIHTYIKNLCFWDSICLLCNNITWSDPERGFYRLPSNNNTGHVVAPKAWLVQQRRFLACCLPFTPPRVKSAPVGDALT